MKELFGCGGKKGDILRSSLRLFAARGYDGVSVRDIARAAGASEAALYKHFGGKYEMALYIFTAVVTEYTRSLREIGMDTEGAVNQLCRIVEHTYDLYRDHPDTIKFALLSQYYFWDEVEEAVKPHTVLREIIADGMESGEIARQDVYFCLSLYSGLMLQPLAQYPFFADVWPEWQEMKQRVCAAVRKLLA